MGPSTARGTERPGCEKWGLETKWISSLTVYLQEKEDGKGWSAESFVRKTTAPAGRSPAG